MAPKLPRSLIHDKTFDDQAELIQPDLLRFDDIFRGIEWKIQMFPEMCEEVEGTTLRIVKTQDFPDNPSIRIYFSITSEEYCTLHWVEFAEPQPEF
jgi:hypothetical protein